MAMRGKKSLLTSGGVFTRSKWKEGMAAAVKLGSNGPDNDAMSIMMADIVRAFDVSPDIAEMFIYAALGANMDKDTKLAIENEITKGWGRQVGKGGWQADYNAGRRDDSWKSFRKMSQSGEGDAASTAASGQQEAGREVQAAARKSARLDRALTMASGGFTEEELEKLNLNREMNSAGYGRKDGNVYMDGVIVGQVAYTAAAGSSIDGLPSAVIQRLSVDGDDR